MKKSLLDKMKSIELQTAAVEKHTLAAKAPISMFFKTAQPKTILYTSIIDGQIDFFTGDNINIPHQHDYFELMYVLTGTLTNYIEDKTAFYQAGSGCLMNRQVSHFEVPDPGCTVVFINFSVSFLEEIFQAAFPKNHPAEQEMIVRFLQANMQDQKEYQRSYIEFNRLTSENDPVLFVLLDSLQQEIATKKIGAAFLQRGLALRLFDALQNRQLVSTRLVSLDLSKEAFLCHQVLNFIEKQHGILSRSELTTAFHYNDEYLNRIVKKQTGDSIMKHSKRARLELAVKLLTESTWTIRQISEAIGFQSEAHFYRFFKENTHLSPGEFRKQHSSEK
ncbi:helix-turn-helix domain-containing protein [Listeria costaricensis]|uniref:helix-turn-helix domain-containing protein n=1 Tax=Listeria costaricensis TaxID=2026604 RepID=UPI0013C5361C|nr:helix-turn-helix transcriptional regulator [Listeria costaricensis]